MHSYNLRSKNRDSSVYCSDDIKGAKRDVSNNKSDANVTRKEISDRSKSKVVDGSKSKILESSSPLIELVDKLNDDSKFALKKADALTIKQNKTEKRIMNLISKTKNSIKETRDRKKKMVRDRRKKIVRVKPENVNTKLDYSSFSEKIIENYKKNKIQVFSTPYLVNKLKK